MRIRKNAKLSPLLFSSSSSSSSFSLTVDDTFQTHVCQLNQSPWDVIPFDSHSIQFENDDNSFTNGGSAATDSLGPDESVASMMDTEVKTGIIDDVAMMVLDDNSNSNQHGKKNVFGKKNSCCNAIDVKGLPCKNVAVKHGHSFCHHHLSLLRSNNKYTPTSTPTSTPTTGNNNNNTVVGVGAGSRRAGIRPRATKKGLLSNPNEFYYYSGFGPRWGKKRGDKNGEVGGNDNSSGENSMMLESGDVDNVCGDNVVGGTSLEIDNEGFGFEDYDDDEEDEDCDDGDNGKKRMRKPVKERSLKSLM